MLCPQNEQCKQPDLASMTNITLNQNLNDAPPAISRYVDCPTDVTRQTPNANDAASINNRNEDWSVFSYCTRSNPSGWRENDPLDPDFLPPANESGDFTLPLDSLLKPIKKNTYSPINQENVQKFLAGAIWATENPQDQPLTVRTPKPIKQQVRTTSSTVIFTGPQVETQQDQFLESIERPNKSDSYGIVESDKYKVRRSRFERYPGREIMYTEHMRENVTNVTKYVRRIRTQSSNPPKWYPRNHYQQLSSTQIPSSIFQAHRNVTHKVFITPALAKRYRNVMSVARNIL